MTAQGTHAASDRRGTRTASPPLPLGERARAGLVLAAWVVLAVSVASWLWFMLHALRQPVGQYDFSTYYAAASALRANVRADIYAPAVIAASGAAGHVQVRPPLPFTYPPLVAYLFVPFTLFSFHIAARLWMACNAAIWVFCALVLAAELRPHLRRALSGPAAVPLPAPSHISVGARGPQATYWTRALADPAPWTAAAISAALCLGFTPAAQTLLLGQINFLVLLPLVLVPWLTRHRHERWVGIALALAAMIKLTPAVLLVYLALRRRWEALIAALAALVALTLASIALIGPRIFFELVPQALRVGTGDATLGHNEALFAPLITGLSATLPQLAAPLHLLEYVLLALLALVIGWVLWRAPRALPGQSGEPSPAAPTLLASDWPAYAVALCAVVLLSPTAWVHHYLWLLPAAALALLPLGSAARWLLGAPPRVALAQPATLLALLGVVGGVLLGLSLPHEWDTQPHPATLLYLGLPLHGVMLEARAVGGLLVLLVAALLALRGDVDAGAPDIPDVPPARTNQPAG